MRFSHRTGTIDLINIFIATSIDVEQLFSCSHLLLSHAQSQLSAQSTHTLLCLGMWSTLGLVKDTGDVKKVTELEDVEGKDTLADGWDKIII